MQSSPNEHSTGQPRTRKKLQKAHGPEPQKFEGSLCVDHIILSKDEASRKGCIVTLTIVDKHTTWLHCHASRHKTAESIIEAFQDVMGPQARPEFVYTDNAPEYKKAFKTFSCSHDKALPHTHETNGVVERANRRVEEGTRCALFQSGRLTEFWTESTNCWGFLWTATEVMSVWFTPYESRHLKKLHGPVILFGAAVRLRPSLPADMDKLHIFGNR